MNDNVSEAKTPYGEFHCLVKHVTSNYYPGTVGFVNRDSTVQFQKQPRCIPKWNSVLKVTGLVP